MVDRLRANGYVRREPRLRPGRGSITLGIASTGKEAPMTKVPRIELDSRSPDTVDGRQIRAVTFQDVRPAYVTATLRRLA